MTLSWLPIGKIVAPQGLQGEVRVYPWSEFPERFEQPGERWLLRSGASDPEPIHLLGGYCLPKKGVYVVKLAGICDRHQAEALRDAQLLVPESDRPPLEEGEFHYLDLLGLEVVDQVSQQVVGTVTDLVNGGNDLLEVELCSAQKDTSNGQLPRVLIPFVLEIVPVVDLKAGRIEITPPQGLLDLTVP